MTSSAPDTASPRLSLGPLAYYWPRDAVLDFYAEMLEAPVDVVYLGETVCSKRRLLGPADWWGLAERFAAAGKEPVISTLTLIESEGELLTLRRLCGERRFLIEANDLAALGLLEGRPFVAGPGINLYNQETLAFLAGLGLRRWFLPVELGRDTLKDLQAARPAGVQTEVLGFGRLPLAYSARCFTARSLDLPKDECGLRCLDYPHGRLVRTQDGEPLFGFNGIQTQSARTHSLFPYLDEVSALGVDLLRIAPQPSHTGRVVETFAAALAGHLDPAEGLERLRPTAAHGFCDGYWTGGAGLTLTRIGAS